jgi:hypothetical protein
MGYITLRAAKRAKNYGERKPHTNASGWCAFVGEEENLQAKNLVGFAEVFRSARRRFGIRNCHAQVLSADVVQQN